MFLAYLASKTKTNMEIIKGQNKELTESAILNEIARIMENDNLSIDEALNLFLDTIIYDDDI